MRLARRMGGAIASPAWLTAQLQAIHGAALIGLWIQDDQILDGVNNVTGIPGRVGGSAVNGSAECFQATRLNGRAAMTTSTSAIRYLQAEANATILTVVVVAQLPSLPFAGYPTLAQSLPSYGMIIGEDGLSALYSGQAQVHAVDGSVTHSVTPGAHILESRQAAGTALCIGGNPTNATRSWTAPIGTVFVLSDSPSAAQRAMYVNSLKRYYRL